MTVMDGVANSYGDCIIGSYTEVCDGLLDEIKEGIIEKNYKGDSDVVSVVITSLNKV
jgi:hypothetical protein